MVPAHVSITAGAVAGLFSSTVTYPLDLARRRVQVCSSREIGAQSIRAMLMHITSTYRKQGIPGLYSGILAEYYKVRERNLFLIIIFLQSWLFRACVY